MKKTKNLQDEDVKKPNLHSLARKTIENYDSE